MTPKTPMTRPITYFLVTMAVVAGGCSRNMVLGSRPDAQDGNQDGNQDGKLDGTGGAGGGGSTGTGGSPGTGGRGSGGGSGGIAGTGGGVPATGGRGTGGGASGGGSSGTGGRATGGGAGGSPGTGGLGSGGNTDGGAGCNADASFWCASGRVTAAGGVSCGDALLQPVCSAGQWICPRDWIPMSDCDCAGLQPTSCMCTPTGLSCPDGGTDAATDAGVCDFGCYPVPAATFCGTGKVIWECWGPSPNESVLVNGGCTDAATDAVRYCCPASFLSQCPPRT